MRQVFGLLLVLFFHAAHAEITTIKDFSSWMMHYYQNPTPGLISPSIKKAIELGAFRDAGKTGAPLIGFIAGATKNTPGLAAELTKELAALDEAQYAVVLTGIWYANLSNGESTAVVSPELTKHPQIASASPLLKTPPIDILSVSVEQGPWVLDAMWGYFFATGDSAPVLKIISALPWLDVSKKEEIKSKGKAGLILMATGGAARWSLTANAKQHPRVMEICRDQLSKQPDIISRQLADILVKARK